MAEAKVEATAEFDMLPAPAKARPVQLVAVNGFLFVLMSDGRIMERVQSNEHLHMGGQHWNWRETPGPV